MGLRASSVVVIEISEHLEGQEEQEAMQPFGGKPKCQPSSHRDVHPRKTWQGHSQLDDGEHTGCNAAPPCSGDMRCSRGPRDPLNLSVIAKDAKIARKRRQ